MKRFHTQISVVRRRTFAMFLIAATSGVCADARGDTTTSNVAPSPVPTVSLTFDDGFASAYHEAAPAMAKRRMAGTVYVTTDFVGRPNHLTWAEVRALQDEMGWEIGSHTLKHLELPTVDAALIANELAESKRVLQERGVRVESFASPYGAYDDRVLAGLARHYRSHRGFWERDGFNRWPYEPFRLHVKSVQGDTPVETVTSWIDEVNARNEWLILVFHDVVSEPNPDYQYTTLVSDFERIVDYLADAPVRVATIREVLDGEDARVLLNQTFADSLDPRWWWTDNERTVRRDEKGKGAYPDPHHAMVFRFESTGRARLVGPRLPVSPGGSYRVEAFVNRTRLIDGDVSMHVDEFDADGRHLGQRILGWVNGSIVQCRWGYRPQSPRTAWMRLKVTVRGAVREQVVIDNLRVVELESSPHVTQAP